MCFSHLGWDFVFQRPQHLMTRATRTMRVVFWEEPAWHEHCTVGLEERVTAEGVTVVRPRLPWGADFTGTLRPLLDGFLRRERIVDPALWYYSPRFLEFTDHLQSSRVVYDCMDELSAFDGADPALPQWEQRLIDRADLVFTGGYSLFEAKRGLHRSVHAFPSGVDFAHFAPARGVMQEPAVQAGLGAPRAGFYGVLDERFDRALLADVARLCPSVQFVMVGPIVKADPGLFPRAPNIHYLGPARYADLPRFVAHWDVALMPFAINAATRFISPTKTPEYLAAGRPVVSTPIVDVVRQYGGLAGVAIAGDAAGFAAAIHRALTLDPAAWRPEADAVLAGMAWDATWHRMSALMNVAGQAAVAAE